MRFLLLFLLGLCAFACGGPDAATRMEYPDDPSILWSVSTGANGVGKPRAVTTPAVGADGTIYVGGALEDKSSTACLYAFSSEGERKQTLCGSQGDFRGAPTIWVVATLDGDGAYAVDEAGGLYSMRPGGPSHYMMLPGAPPLGQKPNLTGPLTVSKTGLVYAGGVRGIYELDFENHVDPVSWSFRSDTFHLDPLYYAVLGQDGLIYAVGPTLHVFNKGGLQLWEAKTGGLTEGGLALGYEGRIVVRQHRGIVALTPGGAVAWKYDPGQAISGAPHVDRRGNIYITGSRSLFSTNQVGSPRWEFQHDRTFAGGMVVRRDTIYVADTSGQILAFDLDGNNLWTLSVAARAATPWVDPYGTSFYIAAQDARLYALVPPS